MQLASSTIDERKRDILEAIIHCYTLTAQPVGSRTIERKYSLGLSAATIRNTMADLEEMGYVAQPHTSAGRVPTESGYRFYVDQLVEVSPLSEDDKQRMKRSYDDARQEMEYIMEQTSKILSLISQYIGVVISPKLKESILRRLELISVAAERILVVLMMESGMVKSRIIAVEGEIPSKSLQKINSLLNEKLSGLPLKKIRNISENPAQMKAIFDEEMSEQAMALTKNAFSLEPEIEVYLEGATSLFGQPEFEDQQKMEAVFRALEEKEYITNILVPQLHKPGIRILIGSEMQYAGMEHCSMISYTYKLGEHSIGVLGIIGPTRMAYHRIIPIVDFTARMMSETLEDKVL